MGDPLSRSVLRDSAFQEVTAHDTASREMRKDRRPMHTIFLGQLSDVETSEVIIDQAVSFGGGEEGLRFPNPPDIGPSNVLNQGAIDPLRHPVCPWFPARNQRV